MRNSIVSLFLVLASMAIHAEPKIILPASSFSTLQLKTQEQYDLQFDGQIWIAGTLVGRWITPPEESVADYLELTIIPDAIMAPRMPSYEGYVTTVIFLSHERSALKLGFSPRSVTDLLSKKVLRLERRGQFLLGKFGLSIDCERQSASAKLIRIKNDDTKIALVNARSCGYSDQVGG